MWISKAKLSRIIQDELFTYFHAYSGKGRKILDRINLLEDQNTLRVGDGTDIKIQQIVRALMNKTGLKYVNDVQGHFE